MLKVRPIKLKPGRSGPKNGRSQAAKEVRPASCWVSHRGQNKESGGTQIEPNNLYLNMGLIHCRPQDPTRVLFTLNP